MQPENNFYPNSFSIHKPDINSEFWQLVAKLKEKNYSNISLALEFAKKSFQHFTKVFFHSELRERLFISNNLITPIMNLMEIARSNEQSALFVMDKFQEFYKNDLMSSDQFHLYLDEIENHYPQSKSVKETCAKLRPEEEHPYSQIPTMPTMPFGSQ